MAGGRLSLCQCFDAACLQSHLLADHIVATHASRQAPPSLALEMENLTSLLDEIIQHPLLTIARQPRSAAYSILWTCHRWTLPQAKCCFVSRCGAQSEPLQPRQDGFGKIRQFCEIIDKVERQAVET